MTRFLRSSRQGPWLPGVALCAALLGVTLPARAQRYCDSDAGCCDEYNLDAKWPSDGATDVSRWTPVLRPENFDIQSADYCQVPGLQDVSLRGCGELLIPATPFRPNCTYTVDLYGAVEHFTTGESDEQPELLVDISEDQDPGENMQLDVTFSQPPVIRIEEKGPWIDVFAHEGAAQTPLPLSGNHATVTYVGAQGQVVELEVEGIAPPEDDEGGCICQAAATPRRVPALPLSMLFSAGVAVTAASRRRRRRRRR